MLECGIGLVSSFTVFFTLCVCKDWSNTNSYKKIDDRKPKDKVNASREKPQMSKQVMELQEYAIKDYEEKNFGYIKVKEVEKVYPTGLQAVEKTSFVVQKGEILGIIGPNGAGKTSLFEMITMSKKRTRGQIKLMNVPITSKKLKQKDLGPKIGIVN